MDCGLINGLHVCMSMCVCVCGVCVVCVVTHGLQLLAEALVLFGVLLLVAVLGPVGLAQLGAELLGLGAQLPGVPLQLRHLTLPLRLAALQLHPQLIAPLLQLLDQQQQQQQ